MDVATVFFPRWINYFSGGGVGVCWVFFFFFFFFLRGGAG